jgi:hypothetical protein
MTEEIEVRDQCRLGGGKTGSHLLLMVVMKVGGMIVRTMMAVAQLMLVLGLDVDMKTPILRPDPAAIAQGVQACRRTGRVQRHSPLAHHHAKLTLIMADLISHLVVANRIRIMDA